MAQSLVTICDRCGTQIPDGHIILKVANSHDQREIIAKSDLCAACEEEFDTFLREEA